MHFSLVRLKSLIKRLIIYPKNSEKNLNYLQGLHFSQHVMLKLIDKGETRENAYKIVQESAMKTWDSIRRNKKKSFQSYLLLNKKLTSRLNRKEIKKIFDNKIFIKNINHIFKSVFK